MLTMRTELLILMVLASGIMVMAQTQTFTRDDVEYKLDLPSSQWQVIPRVDVHNHYEFVNGNDPANGYLRLRKIVVDSDTTGEKLFGRDEKWELQRLPGYVLCSECSGVSFKGELAGVVFAYEYVSAGRVISGKIYYLQVDKHTFYVLNFTASTEKFGSLSNQFDVMARSFRMK